MIARLLILDRLPCKSFLKSRDISLNHTQILCPWCNLVEESLDHVLFSCPWVYLFWTGFFSWWNYQGCFPLTLIQFLSSYLDGPLTSLSKKWWVACFSAALWSLWLAMNDATFDSKSWTVDEILFMVKLRYLFWVKALKEDHLFFDSMWWIDHVACIHAHSHSSVRIFVPWPPPDIGFWKFNVNGSLFGKLGPSGCEGVLQDAKCNIVAIFSGPLGVLDYNVAKLLAIHHVLLVFKNSGKLVGNGLIVESDSRNVVNWEANGFVDALAKAGGASF
ncbi:hypothetical protein REPUB_Repub06bG0144500 [Reevesia pubescens]